jgi:hypothetical protein
MRMRMNLNTQSKVDMVNLYSKKLRSLDELRREKALKKAEAAAAFDATDSGPSLYGDLIPAIVDVITSKGATNKLLALGIPALKLAGTIIEKSLLKKVAIEVLTGYAKWKGTEMGLSALLRLVKRKFEKAAEERTD